MFADYVYETMMEKDEMWFIYNNLGSAVLIFDLPICDA